MKAETIAKVGRIRRRNIRRDAIQRKRTLSIMGLPTSADYDQATAHLRAGWTPEPSTHRERPRTAPASLTSVRFSSFGDVEGINPEEVTPEVTGDEKDFSLCGRDDQ